MHKVCIIPMASDHSLHPSSLCPSVVRILHEYIIEEAFDGT
jgi:hypothetical protein